ncbi:MAG: DNA-3-methyladenine glycosylase [Actinomycetota bacterium]
MTSAGRRLPRRWFARPSPVLARDLLGRVLVHRLAGGERLAVRIVETEAYAFDDPASHSFRGPTPRNAVMFGSAGFCYVYLSYGVHQCMNVVAGEDGVGAAVLLRSAEPLSGIAEMSANRGTDDVLALCSGPGKLCQALGIDGTDNGADLARGTGLEIHEGRAPARGRVLVSTRVGIRTGLDRPWRFRIADDRWVSRARGAGDLAAGTAVRSRRR